MSHICINLKHFIFNISSYHGSSVMTFACLTLARSFLTILLQFLDHISKSLKLYLWPPNQTRIMFLKKYVLEVATQGECCFASVWFLMDFRFIATCQGVSGHGTVSILFICFPPINTANIRCGLFFYYRNTMLMHRMQPIKIKGQTIKQF